MTLPANLNVYVSVALFVVGAYVAALYVGLIVWTFRDIHSRSKDMLAQILATLLVALFTLPGLVVYLLLRPQTTLAEEYDRSLTEEAILQDLEERRVCPNCQHRVDPDYIVCPYCHHQLRLRCVGCGRLLQPNWSVCPYCGLFRDQGEEPALDSESEGETEPAVQSEDATVSEEQPLAPPEPLWSDTEAAEPTVAMAPVPEETADEAAPSDDDNVAEEASPEVDDTPSAEDKASPADEPEDSEPDDA